MSLFTEVRIYVTEKKRYIRLQGCLEVMLYNVYNSTDKVLLAIEIDIKVHDW